MECKKKWIDTVTAHLVEFIISALCPTKYPDVTTVFWIITLVIKISGIFCVIFGKLDFIHLVKYTYSFVIWFFVFGSFHYLPYYDEVPFYAKMTLYKSENRDDTIFVQNNIMIKWFWKIIWLRLCTGN